MALVFVLACGKRDSVPSLPIDRSCEPIALEPSACAPDASEVSINASIQDGTPTQCASVLLLEWTYASGVPCRQRIGSYRSVGMGPDRPSVDGVDLCMRRSGGNLEVMRGRETIASVVAPSTTSKLWPRCGDP